MLNIRSFEATQAEYETLADILKAIDPVHYRTTEELQHYDQAFSDDEIFVRVVAEHNGTTIGYGNFGQRSDGRKLGKFWLNFGLHPTHHRPEYDEKLHAHLLENVIKLGGKKIVTSTKEFHHDRIRLLEQQGYACLLRECCSILTVAEFDSKPFQAVTHKLAQENIAIYALSDLQENDPNWLAKLEELAWFVGGDIPTIDPRDPDSRLTPEEFRTRFERPTFIPDGWFVAVDESTGPSAQGQYVGQSVLERVLDDPKRLGTGVTGVLRTHRRKGIATALKLRAIDFAKAQDVAFIWTENEENNPMYQINLALGFKPEPAWLEYVKVLD